MVALREVRVGAHPVDGRLGLWFLRTSTDTWVGVARADIPLRGSAAQRRANLIADATAAIQAALGDRYVFTLDVPVTGTPSLENITIQDAP
jgi:hypothetical protein